MSLFSFILCQTWTFQYIQVSFLLRRMLFNQAWITTLGELVLASSETPLLAGWRPPQPWPLSPRAHLLFTPHSWASSQVCSPQHGYFPRYQFDSLWPLRQILTKPQTPHFQPFPFTTQSFIFSTQRTPLPHPATEPCLLPAEVFWNVSFLTLIVTTFRGIFVFCFQVFPFSPRSGRPHVGIFCSFILK